jgi:hypothetical protein
VYDSGVVTRLVACEHGLSLEHRDVRAGVAGKQLASDRQS